MKKIVRFMDGKLIKYWIAWKLRESLGAEKYQYHWYKNAFKVRKHDLTPNN